MAIFEHHSRFELSAAELFRWHTRPGSFERLLPPWEDVEILERDPGLVDGARLVLRVGVGPFRRRWVSVLGSCRPGVSFSDEQVQGPFRAWRHLHRFVDDGENSCVLEDRVDYELPGGLHAGRLAHRSIEKRLGRLFRFRHQRLRQDLARHRSSGGSTPRRIAISGASGRLGSALAAFLTSGGHRVDALVRRSPVLGSSEIFWDPGRGELDVAALEGVDAVAHLAGESIAGGRWDLQRKRRILRSRAQGTRLLCERLAQLERPPKTLLSASAIGYYGDRGEEVVDESSELGSGFLADVCQAWEAATAPARDAGIRVIHVRTGVVLSARGGVLRQLLLPFRLGLGGPVGTGRQYMSWIVLDDAVGAFAHLLFSTELAGAVNVVAPQPVTNAAFARGLGRVLKRPAAIRLPAAMIQLAFGEMGRELLLFGVRASSAELERSGFRFLYPTLDGGLRAELGLG